MKFLLIGSAALLLLAILVSVLTRPAHRDTTAMSDASLPSSEGWTCQWLDIPKLRRDAASNQCSGVVHCRHQTMQTLIPQVRQVSCAASGDTRDPTACFTQSLRAL